jgi:hypothetical protein
MNNKEKLDYLKNKKFIIDNRIYHYHNEYFFNEIMKDLNYDTFNNLINEYNMLNNTFEEFKILFNIKNINIKI